MHVLVCCVFEASSQWAHAINVIKMAQGFSRLGHEVTIVCRQPPGGKVPERELGEIYGLTETVSWIQLPRRILGFPTHEKTRLLAILTLLVALRVKPDLIYARSNLFPRLSSSFGLLTIAEKHSRVGIQSPAFYQLVKATQHKNFLTWVTISHRLADYYYSQGVPNGKVCVLPDAVDLKCYQRPEELPPSPYPSDRINVAYVGHLYDYKGIPTVLEAAALLPETMFHFIGGWEEDIARQQQRAEALNLKNVTFYGLKPQVEVPGYLWHADALLLPPSQHHRSAAWTSPVKLGEYLASGTPVVATSIVALRDWLTDEEVEFVEPDNPQALANGIRTVTETPERAQQLRQAGTRKALDLSYEKRVEAVLDHAGVLTSSHAEPMISAAAAAKTFDV